MANIECRRCGCEIECAHDKVTKVGYVSMIGGKLDSVEQGELILCKDCSSEFFEIVNNFVNCEAGYIIMDAGESDVSE